MAICQARQAQIHIEMSQMSTGAALLASANPGCEMQLRAHLDEGYQVRHPVEIYHEALLTSRVEYALAGS